MYTDILKIHMLRMARKFTHKSSTVQSHCFYGAGIHVCV